MRRIVVFGVFDHFHPGHRWFLNRARQHGDHLTVVLARSQAVKALKGHAPCHTLEERKRRLNAQPSVDRVIVGDSSIGSWKIFQRLRPTIIVTGYDQQALRAALARGAALRSLTSYRIVTLPPHNAARWKSSLHHQPQCPYVRHRFLTRPPRHR